MKTNEQTLKQKYEKIRFFLNEIQRRVFLGIEAVKRFNTAAHIPTGSWQPQLPLELAFIELLPASSDPVSSDNRTAPPVERQKWLPRCWGGG